MIVLDASLLANVVADDGPDGTLARQEVRAAGSLAAPDLVDVETAAVLRKRWLAGTLSARRFSAAISDLEDLELDRYPTLALVRRAYELLNNLTANVAAYVALAELLQCELLTGDRKLKNAPGPRCSIRLLQQEEFHAARRADLGRFLQRATRMFGRSVRYQAPWLAACRCGRRGGAVACVLHS